MKNKEEKLSITHLEAHKILNVIQEYYEDLVITIKECSQAGDTDSALLAENLELERKDIKPIYDKLLSFSRGESSN